jgi:hypothetical protein
LTTSCGEGAVPVAWHADFDRPRVGLHGLGRVAVAAISLAATLWVIFLEAQMLGQFRFEHPLHQRRLEPMKQPFRTKQVLWALGYLHQLLQELGLQRNRRRIVHG